MQMYFTVNQLKRQQMSLFLDVIFRKILLIMYLHADMKYRITLLEVEFETEQYRSRLAAAQGDERRALLQELINKVAHIKQIKSAEYDQDYTQVIVILPDDSEYRVKL